MILTSSGKRFVYVSILFMTLSMVLPWESLADYTYLESAGIMMNIIPAIIFIFAAAIVTLKPLAELFDKIGTNYTFLLLCLLNALVLYFGMQYYPDTYTIGYILFPSAIITFMFGAVYSVKRINGLQS